MRVEKVSGYCIQYGAFANLKHFTAFTGEFVSLSQYRPMTLVAQPELSSHENASNKNRTHSKHLLRLLPVVVLSDPHFDIGNCPTTGLRGRGSVSFSLRRTKGRESRLCHRRNPRRCQYVLRWSRIGRCMEVHRWRKRMETDLRQT